MSTAVKFTKLVYQNTRPTPAFADFTGQVLDRERAQHVIIVKNNAPPEMFEAAKRIAQTQGEKHGP